MLSLLQTISAGFVAAALAFGQTPARAEFTAAYQSLAKKDYDSAVAHFRAGLKDQPANGQARKDLAYTLLKTGDDAAARDEFRSALDLDRNDKQAALELTFLTHAPSGQPDAQAALPAAPARSTNLWAFFDSAYRMRADVDYLAQRWSEDGISLLFVASWHNMEPDPGADEYLQKLIAACHRHAILVYAWLELPYVSEKFWADYPDWREKTGLNRDAEVGWRKLMNLQNADCSGAAAKLVQNLLERFDWDGLNLAELSFESGGSSIDPGRFTPLNQNVRSEFKDIADFDPLLLFEAGSPHANAKDRATFLQFRRVVEARMQSEWTKNLAAVRKTKPYLDIVLTSRDEHANLLIETPDRKQIGIDLSAIGLNRSQLSEAVASAIKQHLAVALYSENFIGRADLRALAAVAAGTQQAPPTTPDAPLTIAALNASIQSATVSKAEVDISYRSRARAPVEFDERVRAIELDGAPFWKAGEKGCSGWAMLPPGQHLVTFTAR